MFSQLFTTTSAMHTHTHTQTRVCRLRLLAEAFRCVGVRVGRGWRVAGGGQKLTSLHFTHSLSHEAASTVKQLNRWATVECRKRTRKARFAVAVAVDVFHRYVLEESRLQNESESERVECKAA